MNVLHDTRASVAALIGCVSASWAWVFTHVLDGVAMLFALTLLLVCSVRLASPFGATMDALRDYNKALKKRGDDIRWWIGGLATALAYTFIAMWSIRETTNPGSWELFTLRWTLPFEFDWVKLACVLPLGALAWYGWQPLRLEKRTAEWCSLAAALFGFVVFLIAGSYEIAAVVAFLLCAVALTASRRLAKA